jgi:hypothetical protein
MQDAVRRKREDSYLILLNCVGEILGSVDQGPYCTELAMKEITVIVFAFLFAFMFFLYLRNVVFTQIINNIYLNFMKTFFFMKYVFEPYVLVYVSSDSYFTEFSFFQKLWLWIIERNVTYITLSGSVLC